MDKPILFLDFDRTLFDTAQFYEWLGEDIDGRVADLLGGRIQPPDFAEMLYPDTLDFLKRVQLNHHVVLLSCATNVPLQKKKIDGSKLVQYFDDVLITAQAVGNLGKGVAAREYLERVGSKKNGNIFVDDLPANISEMKTLNPSIRSVEMRRKNEAHETFQQNLLLPDAVVTNLTELLAIL